MEALFSLRYAGSVDYYAAMLRFRNVGIDCTERYDKRRKQLNRMDIVGTNGLQSLSVPLSHPNRTIPVSDIVLSEHGNWRHNHWGALYSAYGRTPFFDYFADDLKSVYFDSSVTTLGRLNLAIHDAVVDFLGLPLVSVAIGSEIAEESEEIADCRDGILTELPKVGEYYQIWKDRHGFQPSLSILDLLFNVGREAVFYLRQD